MDAAEMNAVVTAISSRISKCTIPFCYPKIDRYITASAVVIEIQDRLFGFTCNHTLPDHASNVWIISVNSVSADNYTENEIVKGIWKSKTHWPDAGVIEFHNDKAREFLHPNLEPLTIGDISRDVEVSRMAVVSGFPSEMVDVQKEDTGKQGKKVMATFNGVTSPAKPIEVESWPEGDSTAPETNPAIDIFLPYKKGEVVNAQMGRLNAENFEHAQAHPEGLSGGGIWQAEAYTGGVWTTGLRLVGIQCRSVASEYLRGIRMQPVLELLGSIDNDLKEQIGI